jgi:hypothetical protein
MQRLRGVALVDEYLLESFSALRREQQPRNDSETKSRKETLHFASQVSNLRQFAVPSEPVNEHR